MNSAPTEVIVHLTGKPMAKERVKPNPLTPGARPYTPERTVSYEGRFALEAQHVMAGRALMEGMLIVDMVVVMPIPKSKPIKWRERALKGLIRPISKPDWDNFGKILDGLNMQIWGDDAQIVRGVVDKFYGARPMMAVRIRAATERDCLFPTWFSTFREITIFRQKAACTDQKNVI